MKNYFTISEFAKLRNLNINLLRYYEKIGVLKPAHADKRTGYRYYSPEQLSILDVILLCIDFGMPLKDLTKYINNDEFIKNKELFETGREIAQKRICELQQELDKIEYTLQYLNDNQQYSEQTGFYEREIPERTIVALDYKGDFNDIRKIEMESGRLYGYASEKRLSPVFPAGMLLKSENGNVTAQVFFEVVGKDISDKAVRRLSSGVFLCHQTDLTPKLNLLDETERIFGKDENAELVVSNMLVDKYQIGTRKSEFQKRLK